MKSLKEEFSEEARCYGYCIKESEKRIKDKDYIGAAVFMENAARSLKEMENIKAEMDDLKNGKVKITTHILGWGNRGSFE